MKCSSLCLMCDKQKILYINFAKYHGICENERNIQGMTKCIHCNSMVPTLDYTLINQAIDMSQIPDKEFTECSLFTDISQYSPQNLNFDPKENKKDSFKCEFLPQTQSEFPSMPSIKLENDTSLENHIVDFTNTSPLLSPRQRNEEDRKKLRYLVVSLVVLIIIFIILVSFILGI